MHERPFHLALIVINATPILQLKFKIGELWNVIEKNGPPSYLLIILGIMYLAILLQKSHVLPPVHWRMEQSDFHLNQSTVAVLLTTRAQSDTI